MFVLVSLFLVFFRSFLSRKEYGQKHSRVKRERVTRAWDSLFFPIFASASSSTGKFRSSLFKGLRFPKAEPWSLVATSEISKTVFSFCQLFFWLEQERALWAMKRLRSTEKTRSVGCALRGRVRGDYVFDRALLRQKKKRIIELNIVSVCVPNNKIYLFGSGRRGRRPLPTLIEIVRSVNRRMRATRTRPRRLCF